MNNDHLFRVSIKAVIRNERGYILVVKEKDYQYWNLPGGGMDHGETFKQALKRELYEEIGYVGEFAMKLLAAEDANRIRDTGEPLWQLRLIYEVKTENNTFSIGEHAVAVTFIDPIELKNSAYEPEQMLYKYCV